MSTKTLSGLYGAYVLTSPVSTLSVTASGYVQGGVAATGISRYTVVNAGHIVDQNTTSGNYWGLYLKGGGVVTNSGVVRSFSTTSGGGVILDNGGTVTNASNGLILGFNGVAIGGQSGSVINAGTLIGSGDYGAALLAGGVVDNGSASDTSADIQGDVAVVAAMTATLHNYGKILGAGTSGVGGYLKAGGVITNGSSSDKSASITGYIAAVGAASATATIQNYGALLATGATGAAVILEAGGTVTNGSAGDTSATIRGAADGVAAAESLTVVNFGAIAGGYGSGNDGAIYAQDGGSVTNGSNADTGARLTGDLGAGVGGASGTVANFGTIGGEATYVGALLAMGGQVTNGDAADTTALIQGTVAVGAIGAPATVTNFGTLQGSYKISTGSPISTVFLAAGGTLTNGSNTDATALITGNIGVYTSSAAVGTVSNFGIVRGFTAGVVLSGGGRITNGSVSDITAEISGALFGAVITSGNGTVSNFATIVAGDTPQSVGAATGPGSLINGGSTDHAALIEGYIAAAALSGGKITNYATIAGAGAAGGTGVLLDSGGVLTNEASGIIEGELGLNVSSTATAINFGTVIGEGGEAVTLSAAGARLDMEAGSVFEGAVLGGFGVVDAVGGAASLTALQSGSLVEGAGTISLDGGISYLDSGIKLKVAEIAVGGSSTVVNIETKLTETKTWVQSAGDLAVASGEAVTFKGSGDSFSGTISGPGTVEFDTGTNSLSNLTLSAGLTKLAGAATLTLSGAIDATGPVDLDGGVLVVAAGGATLSGGGLITLTTSGTNLIKGAASAAVLTNADTIKAAGQVGDGVMSLVNSGTIESDFSTALTINTGTRTVVNSGLIEAIGSGGLVVASAVANTGTLMSNAATLTLEGAVTGAGTVRVDGGEVICEGAMNQTVRFGSTGRLALSDSQAFTAAITGFSTTGTTSLDLEDIDFSGASASYSGTASSGVLTVTDGTHTAKIHLTGNYLASSWSLSNDGGGGTVVVDPTAHAATSALASGLASAAAGFGVAGAGPSSPASTLAPALPPLLAATHA